MADIRPLPGFREFYPEDRAIQNHLFTVWRRACRRYGFHEWESPVLEPLELFTEKSGEEIVKQLFNFEDKGGRQVSLRPEMTPSLARMVGARANGMPKPIRWFSIGENFRYEKPQKGRLRSFYQLNADLLGEPSATADAELIALCADCLLGFGLTQKDFSIRISDRQLWFQFLESQKIPNEKITAVLSVVDKLERSSAEDLQTAIKTVLTVNDSSAQELLASIKTFAAIRSLNDLEQFAQKDSALAKRLMDWKILLNSLKSLGFSDCVSIDLTIVRGLAYYTGFVFEAFEVGAGSRALAGGGRYDTLVKKLGGPDLPAAGFGMGDVTVRDLLESKNLLPKYADGPNFYVLILGEEARSVALQDIATLRQAGFNVDYNLHEGKFAKLIQSAETLGAGYALIYGGDEVTKGITKVRSLSDRSEATIPRTDIVPALRAVLEEGMRAILP